MNTSRIKTLLAALGNKWTKCPFTAQEVQMVAREIGVAINTKRNSTGTLEIKRK